MSDGNDVRDLVGDDVPQPELERIARAHQLLRETPAPPEVPPALTAAVLAIPTPRGHVGRRRLLLGIAAAAALAAGTFGIGRWVGQPGGPPVAEQVTLVATPSAPSEATMVISVLPVDKAGNSPMLVDVSGLPSLPKNGYYEVWMTRAGKAAALCGRFVVDAAGQAHGVWLNAPYDFSEYQRWVVDAVVPGKPPSSWLLDGPV